MNKPILYINGDKIYNEQYVEYFSSKMIDIINNDNRRKGRQLIFLDHNYIFDINNFDYSFQWCIDLYTANKQHMYTHPSYQYLFDTEMMPKNVIEYKIFLREHILNKILND